MNSFDCNLLMISLVFLFSGCSFMAQETFFDGIKNYTVIVDVIMILISIGLFGVLSKVIVRIRGNFHKVFFGKIICDFHYSEMGGGILYHWEWPNADKFDELERLFMKKGYVGDMMPIQQGKYVMKWKVTRVEMNTVSNPRYYVLEYFNGESTMKAEKFMKDVSHK
jgi:hypothetical protein